MSGEYISTSEDKPIARRTRSQDEAKTDSSDSKSPSAAAESIGGSAALISFFVIISRITGFMRTWAMAFALGSTAIASSYQVANNLPNMLYELVVGGMLVTAFLPVYVSIKNKLGERGGNEYASNLLSIVFIVLGLVALACTVFAPALIYTQSFMSDQKTMGDAVFFFRFFAIQIVFYGVSTIVSGLLNASRDYLWSSAAPIFNNVIVAATFILYAIVYPSDAELAKLVIAIGNPLGVFVQMSIQIPALKRNGIRIRPHVDLHDPGLRETLSIGIPAIIVMFAGMIIVSVQNSASYAYLDNGPSVIAYARLWFTLPYAFLTVPITTTLFTEISDMHSRNDMEGFRRALVGGSGQIIFFMVPFMMYLIVFADPLVTLYHIGAFTEENISQIAIYLIALAVSLPLYGVNTYMQKAFSALRIMKPYSVMMIAAAVLQIAFIAAFLFQASKIPPMVGMATVALSETLYYLVLDLACFVFLRRKLGRLGLSGLIRTLALSLALGLLGSAAGGAVSWILETTVAPSDGSIENALIRIVCGGLLALVVTFGIAIKMRIPEAAFLLNIFDKVVAKLIRKAPILNDAKEIDHTVVESAWREKNDKAPRQSAYGDEVDSDSTSSSREFEEKISRARHALQKKPSSPLHCQGRGMAECDSPQAAKGMHSKSHSRISDEKSEYRRALAHGAHENEKRTQESKISRARHVKKS